MPTLLCGIDAFELQTGGSAGTAAGAAREFCAALGPALDDCRAGGVEVYRLERLNMDAPLASRDLVLCRLPSWRFDVNALEAMHRSLRELRQHHEELLVKLSRTSEALSSLSAAVEPGMLLQATGRQVAGDLAVGSGGRDASPREMRFYEQELLEAAGGMEIQAESERDGWSPGSTAFTSRIGDSSMPCTYPSGSSSVRDVSDLRLRREESRIGHTESCDEEYFSL
mmetsp:Transcript_68963/g.197800  ORF Transcript_68963/g.197800 Transcript_68963/m.197800 type:complete len:226 (-) Transcript_68963:224-901(-)